jgi:serine/threonine-protein kinase
LELVRNAEPVRPSRLRREIPAGLEAICLKCLEKSPAHRYSSAQALADDLDKWLRDERPEAASPSARLDRFVRRHKTAIAFGLVVLALGMAMGLASYFLDRARTIERIERDLARGQSVTLIGPTGGPKWSRWPVGESRSQWKVVNDTFIVTSYTLALLELVPDPQCESYCFTAQVRHDESDVMGEVGLYVARQATPAKPQDIQFFTQVTFNDVRSRVDLLKGLPVDIKPRPHQLLNVVEMFPHLYSDEAVQPNINGRLGGVAGPRFKPHADTASPWHVLEVTVTPTTVTARWDGQPFSLATATIQQAIDKETTPEPPPGGPLLRGLQPAFVARGGLGFYVWKGSASFRDVHVTPL